MTTPRRSKPVWKRPWFLGAAALIALIVVGAATGGHDTTHKTLTVASTSTAAVSSTSTSMTVTSSEATTPSAPPTTAAAPSARGPGSVDAAARLAALPVAVENTGVSYDRRSDFGPAWSDVDHNGCDTRNDILHRDLTSVELRPGTHDCVVVSGTLVDRYTGSTIAFLKAQADEVQIDHLVPLHAAWELGAYQWPFAQRLAFANDPANLLAVDAHNNEAKGDFLADTWVPPNAGEWCDYAQRTIAVHAKYRLAVTAGEKAALGRLLASCDAAAPAAPPPTPAAPPAPTPTPVPPPPAPSGGEIYYANCTAVRAAGKAPLYAGQPGYRSTLDRDHDGVACE